MPPVKKPASDGHVLPPGIRPDITPAQVVSGIPIVATLLNSFGVFHLSATQQDSLQKTVLWALGLVGGDAAIRLGRNLHAAAHAKRDAA